MESLQGSTVNKCDGPKNVISIDNGHHKFYGHCLSETRCA
jgi:hypothetical protein